MALLNAMHGLFVIGSSFRFAYTGKANYWWFIRAPHILTSMTNATVVGINVILFLRFGNRAMIPLALAIGQFIVSINCLQWTNRMKQFLKDVTPANPTSECCSNTNLNPSVVPLAHQPQTPATSRLQRTTFRVITMEIAFYAITMIITFFQRADLASTILHPPAFDDFVMGFISGYTSALHRAVIIGFGLHGSENGQQAPLLFYEFGTWLFCAFSALETFLTFFKLNSTENLISLGILGIQTLVLFSGAACSTALRRVLITQVSSGGTPDLASSTAIRSSITAIYSFLFGMWWQIECLFLVALSTWKGSPFQQTGVAFNLGIHGMVVFMLSHYKSGEISDWKDLGARLRYYLSFYLMFAVVSGLEFFSCLSDVISRDSDWPLLLFTFVTGIRFFISILAVNAFRIAAVQNKVEGQRREIEGEEPEQELEEGSEDVEIPAASIQSQKVMENLGKEMKNSENRIIASCFIWIAFACFLLLDSFEHGGEHGHSMTDFLGIMGATSPTEIGSHVPAFGIVFHFCLIFTGFGIIGIRLKNEGNLKFALLVCQTTGLISTAALIGSIFRLYADGTSSSPFPNILWTASFAVLSYAIMMASVLNFSSLSFIRNALLSQSVSRINKIW
eukprot:TRINITY_DN6451_c0_g1_i1.p1 TRINITY_DN6451_c0_g1~~TRINITY_DN6451_c0_g1_i1.p1  ORF type:complete len:727 (-),score=160.91 TRINITY_DN6451_c0_g1_i1:96-1955(-)